MRVVIFPVNSDSGSHEFLAGKVDSTLKQEKNPKVKVEIFKNSPTLGLSISGGSDTPNPEVIIEEVKPGGAAFSDGFLKPGFEIVAVNSTPLLGHTHREVVEIISRAFADSNTLKMVVIPNVTAN